MFLQDQSVILSPHSVYFVLNQDEELDLMTQQEIHFGLKHI